MERYPNRFKTKWNPHFVEQVKAIIKVFRPLKSNGSLNYSKIARGMAIQGRTFSHWRNSKSKYYKPELVKAMEKAKEELGPQTQQQFQTKHSTIIFVNCPISDELSEKRLAGSDLSGFNCLQGHKHI